MIKCCVGWMNCSLGNIFVAILAPMSHNCIIQLHANFVKSVSCALLVRWQLMQNIIQQTWQQPNLTCLILFNFKIYGFGFKRKFFIELAKCEQSLSFAQWLWWSYTIHSSSLVLFFPKKVNYFKKLNNVTFFKNGVSKILP